MKKCIAILTYNDGSSKIIECKLEHNLPFGKKEMEKWLREDPNVKDVAFIKASDCLVQKIKYFLDKKI